MSSSVSLNLGLAQTSDITKTNSTMNPETEALLKKIFSASSFSNIQTISFVDGIEVSGVSLGDSTVTVTLRKIATENATNLSTPVTVTAVRVPGSSIKDLMALVEASAKPVVRKHWSSSSYVNTDGRIAKFWIWSKCYIFSRAITGYYAAWQKYANGHCQYRRR
jgi:hypothetical protein